MRKPHLGVITLGCPHGVLLLCEFDPSLFSVPFKRPA